MPDTRELELWRLVNNAFQNSIEKFGDIFAKDVTRELLANGVTVQECGSWKYYHKQNKAVCTNCSFERDLDANFGKAITCPNCGAYMPQPPKGEQQCG